MARAFENDERAGGRRAARVRLICELLEIRALLANTGSTSGLPALAPVVSDKIGNVLGSVYMDYLAQSGQSAAQADVTAAGALVSSSVNYRPSPWVPNVVGLQISGGQIVVDAVTQGSVTALESEVQGLGGTVIGQFDQMVGVWVPVASLGRLAGLSDLTLAEPSYKPILSSLGSIGAVDDQAVQALRSDEARARYNVDGTGITVGILSDSFNSEGGYAGDIVTGDLPAGIKVLNDLGPGEGTDEGRAMAQLVYHVAPGAKIAFTTAFFDITTFANGIINLAKPVAQGGAGAKIIVDDVAYENEPFFQDGLVAQAVEQVIQQYGVTYFSAAGNSGRLAYDSAFNGVTMASAPAPGLGTGTFHNFATSGTADIFQPVSVLEGSMLDLDLQWDQPFASQSLGAAGKAGAQNDLAIYLLDSNKNVIASSTTNTIGGDPFQNIQIVIAGDPNALLFDSDYIVVKLISGAAPHDMTYMFLGAGGGTVTIENYDTQSPTLFGHAKAADAAGVGAVEYDESPSYFLTPPAPEFYSSAGGVPNYFDTNGNRLSSPVVRQQPLFSSIDGTDNTFLGADLDFNGIPNFSGTSAAAPHAAAVAALMLQANPSLTSSQIFTILENSALPLDSGDGTPNVGYSFDGGWGLIQADKALAAVEPRTVSGIVYQDTGHAGHYVTGDPVAAGATVYMDINGSGHFVSGSTSIGTATPLVIPFQTDPSQGPTRVSSPLAVSGVPGLITHLSVTLDLTAVEDFNLGVTLVSPTGIRIPLIEQTGAGISNFPNVTLDDAGLDTVEDPGIIDFTGQVLEPDVKLAALIGENPNGTWHLEGRDFGITPGADSTLNSWSLNIAYADPTATTNSQGNFTFTGPYIDANGSPIVGLAPAAYTGPINVGVQGFPGYSVQINASATATFLKQDATTQGTWINTYGASGNDVIGKPAALPAYATVTPSGQSSYAWALSTTDTRALQVPGGGGRIAATWFAATSFKVDVNLTDGQLHNLELYFLDWDTTGRAEQVQISDQATGAILSTQSVSSFHSGVYLDYTVGGHIVITITRTAGLNAVLSGLFFDPQPAAIPTSSATFLKQDATTQGTWINTYGASGNDVIGKPAALPAYATVTPSGQSSYAWALSTTDTRALQVPGGGGRIAATWFAATSFKVDVNLTDGQLHNLELYFLDWDTTGRAEQVQISDQATGAILSTQSVSSFHSGVYLDYTVGGHIVITITRTAGLNAVLSGLFFDPQPAAIPTSSATFLKQDATTQGTWINTYGASGNDVIGKPAVLPTYATVTPSGQSSYAWALSTTDTRALQVPGGGGRIAATWFSATSFKVDVNLTDGQLHNLELYFLDWDTTGRAEQVQISDQATGVILSTQSVSSFHSGVYLDYTVGGHIVITITRTAGLNAVLSGLFFDPAPSGTASVASGISGQSGGGPTFNGPVGGGAAQTTTSMGVASGSGLTADSTKSSAAAVGPASLGTSVLDPSGRPKTRVKLSFAASSAHPDGRVLRAASRRRLAARRGATTVSL